MWKAVGVIPRCLQVDWLVQYFFLLLYTAIVFPLFCLDIPFDGVLMEGICRKHPEKHPVDTSEEDGSYPSKQTASMKAKIGTGPLKSFHIMHFPLSMTELVSIL